MSHLHPQFHHILQSHTYTHTLKLTRWLPRHTTRRLFSTFYASCLKDPWPRWNLPLLTSPGWQGETMVHCLYNRLALRQSLGLATFRPRGMKSTRPTSAARAKELGENKGVADNGLTNTNNNILTTTNDDPRWHFGDTGDFLVSIFSTSPLHYLNKDKTVVIKWNANKSYIIQIETIVRFFGSKIWRCSF